MQLYSRKLDELSLICISRISNHENNTKHRVSWLRAIALAIPSQVKLYPERIKILGTMLAIYFFLLFNLYFTIWRLVNFSNLIAK